MTVKVSIITPCYNDGKFLGDCISSTEDVVKTGIAEHIIVNDGSTDKFTLDKLKELELKGYKIIYQENKGLGATRNVGIDMAKGKYILPLDADNKIAESFVQRAIGLMDNDPAISIVYGDAMFFGDANRYSSVLEFDIQRMLYLNYIDACAIYRREVWVKNNGYAVDMPAMGHEDWEFWINAHFKGFQFHYIPILSFYYRVRADSMLRTTTKNKEDESRKYVFKKHLEHISNVYSTMAENYFSMIAQQDFIKKYMKTNRIKSIAKVLLGIEIKS